MKIAHLILFVAGFVSAGFILASQVQASKCESVYGGGEVCEFGKVAIEKWVKNPGDNHKWYENIDSSNYTFGPNDTVEFQFKIKNISDVKVDKALVRDYLPSYVNWVSGGNWLSGSRISEFDYRDLDPGEEMYITMTVKVNDANNLPVGTTCVTNEVKVFTEDKSNADDSDTSMFCIKNGEGEKKVLGVTTLPDTGAGLNALVLAELVGFTLMGAAYVAAGVKRNR